MCSETRFGHERSWCEVLANLGLIQGESSGRVLPLGGSVGGELEDFSECHN